MFLVGLVQAIGLQNSAVLLYTSPTVSNSLIALKYNGTFARSYLKSFTLPANLQATSLRCKVFSGKPNCFLLSKQNMITHMVMSYRTTTNSLKITFQNSYSLYKDFVPNKWSFNEDYLVTKARNTETEIMLVYQISKSTKTEAGQIWWGLNIQDYYNNQSEVKTTTSVPFVFRSAQGNTAIRFTQNQMFGHFTGNHSVLRAFKAESSLLVLKNGILESEAGGIQVGFSDDAGESKFFGIENFFANWNWANTKTNFGGIPTLIWILVAAGVLFLIVIVLLRSSGGKDDNGGNDSYFGEEDYTELDKEEDEKVAISGAKIKKMTA